MKCLLVDDEPGIREGLATLLRRRGFEVHTAGDCAEARTQLGSQRFDVVVTDWRLPDGVASAFAIDCVSPVLAVSGHPEEVQRAGAICEVLAKPVRPNVLVERIAACAKPTQPEQPPEPELVLDVQRVIDDVLAQLPDGVEATLYDDGTFVVLRAALPDGYVSTVRSQGGDLRVLESSERRELELRLFRDGRSDTDETVAPVGNAWPDHEVSDCSSIALDCAATDATPQVFALWLRTVQERRAKGGKICLINVPDRLDSITSVWERTHDMPMRERVGPRLSAELAELWS